MSMANINSDTKVLELGYFIDEANESQLSNYRALIRTIEDGVILPGEWETVDETGESISPVDHILGGARYVSFVEIPTKGESLANATAYGLGFSQDFLEQQDVEPVEYLVIGEDIPRINPAQWVQERIEDIRESPEYYEFLREHAAGALQTLRDDPIKRAVVRVRMARGTNHIRTYYEIITPEMYAEMALTDPPAEWRGTSPVQFTIDDVQTVYVSTIDEVSHFRQLYPEYHGTFVVLG